MAERNDYDVILADVRMPSMSGVDMVSRMKSTARKLFMTGYPKGLIDTGIKFLQKPFGLNELYSFVETT